MQRYFTEKRCSNNSFSLSKEDMYHIQKVMRLKEKDLVEVIFDKKLYICEIDSFNDDSVLVNIVEEKDECNELGIHVTLVQSLVKEQKMDYILQKCVELGVCEIYPYQADRSVVKLTNKEVQKQKRWQTIAKEASEQSKREVIPMVRNTLSLKELCEIDGYDYKFLATVNEKSQNLKKVLSNIKECATMIIVVGPEGGFTKEEEDKMMSSGFVPVSLGKSVLRTETAGLFIMSAIRYIDME